MAARRRDHGIWWLAFGYFACYAPYSALTKALSEGSLPGMRRGMGSFEILPSTTLASLAGTVVFLSAMGFWKHAGRREILGVRVPWPGPWTFLSGLASAAIIATTTLAYTFSGVSIVFMMLLMRGGVLVIAPIVDAVERRAVRWFSWAALALSLGSLLAAFSARASTAMTAVAAIDVVVYLGAYFVRLRFMSRRAKSDDDAATLRYFVEEQMVATPAVVLVLAILAAIGAGDALGEIRRGFTAFWGSGAIVVGAAVLVGLLSQGTGIFGGLILLDKRENTFCVPVNRASSVLAGIVATVALSRIYGMPGMPAAEIAGAGLVIAAIGVLAVPSLLAARAQPRSAY